MLKSLKMRQSFKKLLGKANLLSFAQDSLQSYRSMMRKISKIDDQIAKQYFAISKSTKLHIGCGTNVMNGWLNSEFHPAKPSVMHLDATKPFPFEDGKFDYIYSEHFIEHISYQDGIRMLQECYRVLKHDSTIRIATPNLQFLIDLYQDRESRNSAEYIQWATDNFIQYAPYHDASFVLNNFFRGFGHLFIYDESTLCASLRHAGFTSIVKCDINRSEDIGMQSLEHVGRRPPSFYRLETMVLEARKL